jgi:hypothetical protein
MVIIKQFIPEFERDLESIEVIEDRGIRDISPIIDELIFVIVWLFNGLSLPCFFLGWSHLAC